MTFVDTAGWAALFVGSDPDHLPAAEWIRQHSGRLVTSDYVLDETLTLLKARHGVQLSVSAGDALWSGRLATLVYLSPADIREGWRVFRNYSDKGWSFTDCTSYALMRRLRMAEAFSFDRHFSQMPGIHRVP